MSGQYFSALFAKVPPPWNAYRMTLADTGESMTPEQIGEYVKNSVVKSADESGTSDFLFVHCEKPDGGADVALIGNGPNAAEIAALIASLPELVEDNAEVRAALSEKDARIAELEGQKDGAYTERNALVAALSKLLPACLVRHPEADIEWEDDWRWIVFIDAPTGQLSWHIHDSERAAFDHLEVRDVEWDGHTTLEKYARLAALPPQEEASE